jgi:FkbM family methyltransferase
MPIWSSAKLFSRAVTPHAGIIALDKQGVLFSELNISSARDWQLMNINIPELIGELVHLRLTVKNPKGGPTILYLGLNGGVNLGFVNLEDMYVKLERADCLTACEGGGEINIEARFSSVDGVILIGTASSQFDPLHPGADEKQIIVTKFEVNDVFPPETRPRITVLDVGAAGGVEQIWDRFIHDVDFVMVEPDPAAAELLKSQTNIIPHITIIQTALAGENGKRQLNITKAPACSSLLEPDFNLLSRYAVSPAFHVANSIEVECVRYDYLCECGAPKPDYIKIDTQGTELEILRGFGDLLHGCLAIQLEAHFYPIYKHQSLIGDVVAYLSDYGLRLRDMVPCWSFDSEWVEVNCVFTQIASDSTPPEVLEKIKFIEEALIRAGFNLGNHDLGRQIARGLI